MKLRPVKRPCHTPNGGPQKRLVREGAMSDQIEPVGFRQMFSGRERDRVCSRCGAAFVQKELSEAMVAKVKALSERAQRIWNNTIPENALPLYCVPCERRDLGRFGA